MWIESRKREKGSEKSAEKKIHSEELRHLQYSSVTNHGVIESRNIHCGCVKHSRNVNVVGMIILKPILRKYNLKVSMRFSWYISDTGSCERNKKLTSFVKWAKFFDRLSSLF